MTRRTPTSPSFDLTNRHPVLRLLVVAGLYASLAVGFVASVEHPRQAPVAAEASRSLPAGSLAAR